jgi:hypothetical protein
MSASVAIITACTANQAGKPAVGATGVAFLYVFLVVFAFAWVSNLADIFSLQVSEFADTCVRHPCNHCTQPKS